MLEQLDQIEKQALSNLQSLEDEDALQNWKVAHLGRSSPLMGTFDQLRDVPKEQRPAIGRRANEVKQALEAAFEERQEALRHQAMHQALETERISNVKVAQHATLRRKPVSPRKGTVLMLGLFVSAVASLAAVLFMESQDQSLKSREEIEEQLRLPVLLSIPRLSGQQVLQN